MKISSAEDIGRIIKQKRKDDGLTLEEAAAVCGVSYAFLSALENGKETVRLNKVLQVLHCLGIELSAATRSWAGSGDVSHEDRRRARPASHAEEALGAVCR